MARRRVLLISILVAAMFALVTVDIEHIVRYKAAVTLLFPGIILAMATGNVHAFSLWLAALGNFVVWFLLCWLLGTLLVKLGGALASRRQSR